MNVHSISDGQTVWFDRGSGVEYGDVMFTYDEYVAIAIGRTPVTGDVMEKIILPVGRLFSDDPRE